ncbi:hypothetical protein GOB93_07320 [Acetobacter musti]|uniref:Uncharacterized protein n=1 Tax=Acetobacter musti TaxID=864732 RepID=A0ABX0JNV6_9PROT|nr:hypothetical protein [Acetobacter musti]NHN84454.1 hypothetical protein [Acetobacter musti]
MAAESHRIHGIPLTVATPEQLAVWQTEAKRDALLLDMTSARSEFGPKDGGWLETQHESAGLPGFRALSAEDAKSDRAGTGMRPAPGTAFHGQSCPCCAARNPLTLRLLSLFQARARGQCAFFRHIVLAVPANRVTAVSRALAADPTICSLFDIQTGG